MGSNLGHTKGSGRGSFWLCHFGLILGWMVEYVFMTEVVSLVMHHLWYVFSWFSQVLSSSVNCLSVLLLNWRCTLKPSCPGDKITQCGENVHSWIFLKSVFVQLNKNSHERSF